MVSSNKLTKGSILTSLNIILFLFSKIFNIADLTFLVFSSMIMCFSIIKFGLKYSSIILISSTITAFSFGLIEYSIAYLAFFGVYPMIKFYTENKNNILIEYLLKLSYCNILLLILGYIYLKLFLPVKITFQFILLYCIASSIIIFIYDKMLTRIIIFFYGNEFIKNL